MINVVTILFESITTWLCLHIVFGKKIEKRWLEVGLPIVYLFVFSLISFQIINTAFYLLIIVFLFVWCYILFKQKKIATVVKTFLGMMLVGITETIVLFFADGIIKDVDDVQWKCALLSLISMIIILTVYIFTAGRNVMVYKYIIEKQFVVYVFIVLIFLTYMKVEFEMTRRITLTYAFFFVILFITFWMFYKQQKISFELQNKEMELSLHDTYGSVYNELLQQVRRKQHDYKNQLIALESMYSITDSREELISKQLKYIDILKQDFKENNILTKCNNPIISGYIYSLYEKYKLQDVYLDVDVIVDDDIVDVKTKEIIEIIGVLVSNAYEYVCEYDVKENIKLYVRKNNDIYTIKTENVVYSMSYSEIDKLFEYGYSTKGKNRGIGLNSVKAIVDKCNGEIYSSYYELNNIKWFFVEIKF